MSGKKTLSSRESPEDGRISILHDMLFMALDARDNVDRVAVEEFPDTLDESIACLEDAIVELAVDHTDLQRLRQRLAEENVLLDVALKISERMNHSRGCIIKDCAFASEPVSNTVLQTFMQQLGVKARVDVNTQTVTYSFEVTNTNDGIRDALREAIRLYNQEVVESHESY